MANKPKVRDARADSIKSLQDRRALYVDAGQDTSEIDAALEALGADVPDEEPADPAAETQQPAGPDTAVSTSDTGSGDGSQPAATTTGEGDPGKEDEVENKKTDDGTENTSGTAPLENKANPASQPARSATKPGQRPSGQSKG